MAKVRLHRRLNKDDICTYHNGLDRSDPRNGHMCTVVEELEGCPSGDLSKLVYSVQFKDGFQTQVWGEELEPCSKPRLSAVS